MGVAGPGRGGRLSRQRKRDAVLRLLRGEDLGLVSRALGVTAATPSGWHDAVLAAGEAGLAPRPTDGALLGAGRPLALRGSKPPNAGCCALWASTACSPRRASARPAVRATTTAPSSPTGWSAWGHRLGAKLRVRRDHGLGRRGTCPRAGKAWPQPRWAGPLPSPAGRTPAKRRGTWPTSPGPSGPRRFRDAKRRARGVHRRERNRRAGAWAVPPSSGPRSTRPPKPAPNSHHLTDLFLAGVTVSGMQGLKSRQRTMLSKL